MLPLLLFGRLCFGFGTGRFDQHRSGRMPASELTVERTLNGEFSSPSVPDEGSWRSDGVNVLMQRDSKSRSSGADIVSVDPATGKSKVLVSAEKLIPTGTSSPLNIEQMSLSEDGKRLLIFTNSVRVWRQNTRGDYWALDITSGKLLKLGGDALPSSLMFAKFSPDGSRVGYVSQNNLYVQDLSSGQITALTTSGSDSVINGTSDWVYEEELDVRDGWRWSPDGMKIAFWQIDAKPEPLFSLINDTDSLYPEVRTFPYPKTGQNNPTVRIGVVNVNGRTTTWVNDVADSKSGYIARMQWTPDAQGILLQHLNRKQNVNDYEIADCSTGTVQTVYTDQDKTWVDVVDTGEQGVRWVDAGKAFLVSSEQDGWRHLYRVPARGGKAVLLTEGNFDIDQVVGIAPDLGLVYFTASPENATQRYLYACSFRQPGNLLRLTPSGQVGTHSYQISPNGKLAFHTWSSFAEPPITDLVRLPDHMKIRSLANNKDVKGRIAKLKLGSSKFIELNAADGSKMDASLIYPPDFDPNKKYPVLFNVYGEPAGAIVQDSWDGGHLFDELIAQHGYIVAAVDNRGTPSLKGRGWRKSVYRKIGVLASEDQAAAVRQIDRLPYVDASRIGIWGWSGGGTMTLNMLFRYPDLYKVGMSVAPVPDMHLYDTIYQERYMGLPQENEADYVAGSPITHAKNLKGSLLIVHGSGDDNVHYQGTERLVNELVADDKQFQLMVYPNRTHSINEGPGTTLHLYKLLFQFLMTHMGTE